MAPWLFGKRRKAKAKTMGCGQSTGHHPDDTVINTHTNGRVVLDPDEPEHRPGQQQQALLPGHPNFNPSVNGKNGFEFNSLYKRTEEQLDGGNFGQIFKCQHLQGSHEDYWKIGAVKVTHPNALDTLHGPINSYEEIEQRCQEVRTLILLQRYPPSPHILRMQEFFYNRNTKELKVVTELLQMNLRDWIDQQQQFTERQGRSVASVLVDALQFMHARNIVHRDIKEANVVFACTGDLSSLKLVDFGLAKDLRPGEKEKAFCGSMGYIAPEIYLREPYSYKVDLFSFGVLMFKILSGKRPWPAGPQEETARRTVNLEYRIVNDHWRGVSVHGRDFIRNLLVFEEERLDALQAGQHDWLHENTVSILRTNFLDQSAHNAASDAVINPEGASRAQQDARERSKFWIEDNVLDALRSFIPVGAFRGAIVPGPAGVAPNTSRIGGHWLVEEHQPEGAKLLPFYIIDSQVYTERECRNVCREIAKRIKLFHNGNVVHRKLHMENVVVEGQPGDPNFNVSLRGIQYAQMIRENEPLTGRVGRQLRGWQAFIGPEIQSEFYHDKRVDLWSLGAIIYMCLCGAAPVKPELYFDCVKPSADAQDLVRRLLQRNPRDRLSIDAVLRHPWMTAPDEVLGREELFLAKIFFQDYERSGRR